MENPAAPVRYDEQLGDIQIFERHTQIVKSVRYNPTRTTWVHVYRGLFHTQPVLVFRPADWLWDSSDKHGEAIIEDLGPLPLLSGENRQYLWAAIAFPLGVRLRALSACGLPFPEHLALDIALQTRLKWATGSRPFDTYVTCSGQLAFVPSFAHCRRSEEPSMCGEDVFDGLVIADADALAQLLTGGLPPPYIFKLASSLHQQGHDWPQWMREAMAKYSLPSLPPQISPVVQDVCESKTTGRQFFDLCTCAAKSVGLDSTPTLAQYFQQVFPEEYIQYQRLDSGGPAGVKNAL